MTTFPQCIDCKHLVSNGTKKFTCSAFPNGIPREILFNEVDHTKPYEGDNGIQFEPLTKK